MTAMARHISYYEELLEGAATIDGKLDRARIEMEHLGLSALIYDYTPVTFSHTGELITPSFFGMRDVPDDMSKLWSDSGFYQIDPVQQLALRSAKPFVWSYRPEDETVLGRILTDTHAPVVVYVRDSRITCGMTVPIHLPRGDCATVTGIRHDAERGFDREAQEFLADFAILAHVLHESVEPLFGPGERASRAARLTPRERECVRFSAEGLSAKEVSLKIGRSEPTIQMHLNAAARKLDARNKAQLMARAAHYRLLA